MYLLELAQKEMKVAGAKRLAADVLMEEDLLGKKVQTHHGRVKSSKSSCTSISSSNPPHVRIVHEKST